MNFKAIIHDAVHFRQGKRWKQKYCALSRQTKISDSLHLFVFKDKNEYERFIIHNAASGTISHSGGSSGNTASTPPASFTPLDDVSGFLPGVNMDNKTHVIRLICQTSIHCLAFSEFAKMENWSNVLKKNLQDEYFRVKLLRIGRQSGKVQPGQDGCLHIERDRICFVGDPVNSSSLPKLLISWEMHEIAAYGPYEFSDMDTSYHLSYHSGGSGSGISEGPQEFCLEGGLEDRKGFGLFVFGCDKPDLLYKKVHNAVQFHLPDYLRSLHLGNRLGGPPDLALSTSSRPSTAAVMRTWSATAPRHDWTSNSGGGGSHASYWGDGGGDMRKCKTPDPNMLHLGGWTFPSSTEDPHHHQNQHQHAPHSVVMYSPSVAGPDVIPPFHNPPLPFPPSTLLANKKTAAPSAVTGPPAITHDYLPMNTSVTDQPDGPHFSTGGGNSVESSSTSGNKYSTRMDGYLTARRGGTPSSSKSSSGNRSPRDLLVPVGFSSMGPQQGQPNTDSHLRVDNYVTLGRKGKRGKNGTMNQSIEATNGESGGKSSSGKRGLFSKLRRRFTSDSFPNDRPSTHFRPHSPAFLTPTFSSGEQELQSQPATKLTTFSRQPYQQPQLQQHFMTTTVAQPQQMQASAHTSVSSYNSHPSHYNSQQPLTSSRDFIGGVEDDVFDHSMDEVSSRCSPRNFQQSATASSIGGNSGAGILLHPPPVVKSDYVDMMQPGRSTPADQRLQEPSRIATTSGPSLASGKSGGIQRSGRPVPLVIQPDLSSSSLLGLSRTGSTSSTGGGGAVNTSTPSPRSPAHVQFQFLQQHVPPATTTSSSSITPAPTKVGGNGSAVEPPSPHSHSNTLKNRLSTIREMRHASDGSATGASPIDVQYRRSRSNSNSTTGGHAPVSRLSTGRPTAATSTGTSSQQSRDQLDSSGSSAASWRAGESTSSAPAPRRVDPSTLKPSSEPSLVSLRWHFFSDDDFPPADDVTPTGTTAREDSYYSTHQYHNLQHQSVSEQMMTTIGPTPGMIVSAADLEGDYANVDAMRSWLKGGGDINSLWQPRRSTEDVLHSSSPAPPMMQPAVSTPPGNNSHLDFYSFPDYEDFDFPTRRRTVSDRPGPEPCSPCGHDLSIPFTCTIIEMGAFPMDGQLAACSHAVCHQAQLPLVAENGTRRAPQQSKPRSGGEYVDKRRVLGQSSFSAQLARSADEVELSRHIGSGGGNLTARREFGGPARSGVMQPIPIGRQASCQPRLMTQPFPPESTTAYNNSPSTEDHNYMNVGPTYVNISELGSLQVPPAPNSTSSASGGSPSEGALTSGAPPLPPTSPIEVMDPSRNYAPVDMRPPSALGTSPPAGSSPGGIGQGSNGNSRIKYAVLDIQHWASGNPSRIRTASTGDENTNSLPSMNNNSSQSSTLGKITSGGNTNPLSDNINYAVIDMVQTEALSELDLQVRGDQVDQSSVPLHHSTVIDQEHLTDSTPSITSTVTAASVGLSRKSSRGRSFRGVTFGRSKETRAQNAS